MIQMILKSSKEGFLNQNTKLRFICCIKNSQFLVFAAGYPHWPHVFFWLWKALLPQRRHNVWVFVWRLPKLDVPFVYYFFFFKKKNKHNMYIHVCMSSLHWTLMHGDIDSSFNNQFLNLMKISVITYFTIFKQKNFFFN